MRVNEIVPIARVDQTAESDADVAHRRASTTLEPRRIIQRDDGGNQIADAAQTPLASPPTAERREVTASQSRAEAVETIDLVYHGHVFDASGYGQAARATLHALHAAGINLAVVDMANHRRQVTDPLVQSLIGRRINPDFHLFHGIPPQWANRAFPLRNVIGMTVWETDAMPPQWRPVLNHALEVWLPCDFNVSVFGRALEKPVFRFPHPWAPARAAGASDHAAKCGIREDDFVFYSIFEWQERKGPNDTLEAFLRAFPEPAPVVLVIKSNPGAAAAAASTLAELRRRVPSAARIELRCESWSDEQIAALHERGDCYVSLHRGEGWNYPLFEAAGRGKAVVATGFSGPVDYLDAAEHHLVRFRAAAVRQRYAYYSTTMRWVEPDVAHAAELLRTALARRELTESRRTVADRIRRDFSLEAVGALARERLMTLLRRTNAAKWQRIDRIERAHQLRPAVPISGAWFDEDYFEHGRKSNWSDGYRWPNFAGLFRETAEFLATSLPDAKSFLDAGCAKGFLVRTLRERGLEAWGFDHSAWAIDHAEELALPFVQQAGVDDVAFEREFDVLLTFSLFESLTEMQATNFMQRVRGKIRHAMIAVISASEGEDSAPSAATERDLSKITLRSRAWWHELFLRAGWRQDALARLAQTTLERHPLAARMGWKIFAYTPA